MWTAVNPGPASVCAWPGRQGPGSAWDCAVSTLIWGVCCQDRRCSWCKRRGRWESGREEALAAGGGRPAVELRPSPPPAVALVLQQVGAWPSQPPTLQVASPPEPHPVFAAQHLVPGRTEIPVSVTCSLARDMSWLWRNVWPIICGVTIMGLIWCFIIEAPGGQREKRGLGPGSQQPPSAELCDIVRGRGDVLPRPWGSTLLLASPGDALSEHSLEIPEASPSQLPATAPRQHKAGSRLKVCGDA